VHLPVLERPSVLRVSDAFQLGPSTSQHPAIATASLGAVLGCWVKCTVAVRSLRPKFHRGNWLPRLTVRNQYAEAMKRSRNRTVLGFDGVDRGFRVMLRIINALYEEYCQARLDEMLLVNAVK
jgi:hypothetical protein